MLLNKLPQQAKKASKVYVLEKVVYSRGPASEAEDFFFSNELITNRTRASDSSDSSCVENADEEEEQNRYLTKKNLEPQSGASVVFQWHGHD